MKRFRFTLVIIVIPFLCLCTNNRLVKEMEEFMDQQIILSSDWHTILKGKDTSLYKFTDTPMHNTALWQFYKNTIKKMIDNDGILPH